MTDPNSIPVLGATRRQIIVSAVTAGVAKAALSIRPVKAAGPEQRPVRIGVINDQTSVYSAPSGPGSVAAAQLAVNDFGGRVLGRPIEILIGDHQNKPDLGAAIVRGWLDSGVSAMVDGGSSAVALAIQQLARERNRPFLISGSSSSDLTGKACSPMGIQWLTDAYCVATATVRSYMVEQKQTKDWFLLIADYSFGYDLEHYATAEVERNGGRVVGKARFPLGNADFAAALLQAQSSGAQAIAIGSGGADAVNAIKQAGEFGLTSTMRIVDLALYSTDLEGLGHEAAQGLSWVTSFYWDRDEASRDWTRRFRALRNQMPTRIHAGTYSAVLNYLRAVDATGTDDGPTVVAKMKATPLSDSLFKDAKIRDDGRVMLPIYMMRCKTLANVREPNDWAEVVSTLPAEEAYRPLRDGGCPYIATTK